MTWRHRAIVLLAAVEHVAYGLRVRVAQSSADVRRMAVVEEAYVAVQSALDVIQGSAAYDGELFGEIEAGGDALAELLGRLEDDARALAGEWRA